MTVVGYLAVLLYLSHVSNCHIKKNSDDHHMKKWNGSSNVKRPTHLVVTTWSFEGATETAYNFLSKNNGSAVDAVVEGCSYCEREQCDFTVGYGGSPDENGETTLDAMIFDGVTMNIGAVGGLKRIKNAVGVARAVLLHTEHSILVGDAATEFAKHMGFEEETLSTNRSTDEWFQWRNDNCQPNFWEGVTPDPKVSCGPYRPLDMCSSGSCQSEVANSEIKLQSNEIKSHTNKLHHDTIGQIIMDSTGAVVAGLSSNGAAHKIPGRMGDAAVPGAGGYADARYGAAISTGDGDIMMRFSPSATVVEKLKHKMSPQKATWQVIQSIREKYPEFNGAIVAVNAAGNFGAACNGFDIFPFTVSSSDIDDGRVRKLYITCS